MNQIKDKAKQATKETALDWKQWLLLASVGVEQAITNFVNIEPLFGGYAKYVLGALWVARIGFIVYRASKAAPPTS